MLMALVKIAISVALLWALFANVDAGAVLRQMAGARLELLIAALAALLVLAIVQAYRWTVVLKAIGVRLGLRPASLMVLIGLFFNQTLPSTIGGDAVRMWRAHKLGLDLAPAVNGVMIDRLSALAALLLVAIIGVPKMHGLLGDGIAFWVIPGFILAGLAGFAVLMALDRLPPAFMRWRAVAALGRLSGDARRTLIDRRYGPAVIGLSLFIQVCVSSTVWLIAAGLGLDVGWFDCLILVPPVMLISMVPISIAGWGVREGAMVSAFGLVGLSAGDALALSIMFGVIVSLVGVPGGMIWALTRPKRPDPADAAARGAAAASAVKPEAGRPAA
jgi:uncharacterized membrane protein YbhN (UPF0104 family)